VAPPGPVDALRRRWHRLRRPRTERRTKLAREVRRPRRHTTPRNLFDEKNHECALALAAASVLDYTVYAVSALPPLRPRHSMIPKMEFYARRDGSLEFADYQQLERRLFAELDGTVAAWKRDDEALLHSRFNAAGVPRRPAGDAPCSRRFRLTSPQPRERRAAARTDRLPVFDEGAGRFTVRAGFRGHLAAPARPRNAAVDDDACRWPTGRLR